MKRALALIFACTALIGAVTGCQPKKRKQGYENTAVTQQKNESYEEAIKECFNASYSLGGGEVFYTYMYPDAAIDAMKQSGQYEELISTFNNGQENRFKLNNNKIEFDQVIESQEIDEKQKAAAKTYLKQLSELYKPDLTEDDLDIKEGYQVTYSHLRDGEYDGKDTVIVLKLNDEGWKVITG